MLTKKDGTKLIKPIPFGDLNFRKPYTEKWQCDGTTTVFFSDVAKKSGLVLEKYTDILGKNFLRISCAESDMYSNALILYSYMQKIKATNVEYCFIPCSPKSISSLKKAVWLGYLNHPIYDSFDKLRPWFENGKSENFPKEELSFFSPFTICNKGERHWNFYDVRDRPGFYVITEDGVIVRTGQSWGLHQRPRAYFYPISKDKGRETSHYKVSYYDRMINNEHEYKMAVVPVPLGIFNSWCQLYKELDKLEDKLIFELDPRDNVKGKRINDFGVNGFVPMFNQEGEAPF